MIVLAHRGLWRRDTDKNSLEAMRNALREGFGLETDLRDDRGRIVISHDPPTGNEPSIDDLLTLYNETGTSGTLALNIKSDGLQTRLAQACETHQLPADRFFVFDMAVPDALSYINMRIQCFTRQSEVEPEPVFIASASGVWLDCFYRDWIDRTVIVNHCDAGRRVALVSPELHRRDKTPAWAAWRDAHRELTSDGRQDMVMICTDFPEQARDYFRV